MSFAPSGFFNPAGEGGGPSIEAAAATAVLGAVVNLADWQYRRTKEQLEVIGGVITNIAAVGVDVAGNIWDALNSPPTEAVEIRPIGFPLPTSGSEYIKARTSGGTYNIQAIRQPDGAAAGQDLGPASHAHFVRLEYTGYNPGSIVTSGWFAYAYSVNATTGQITKQILFPGGSSNGEQWGSYPELKPDVVFTISLIGADGSNTAINDFDPFVGPVPGTSTPVRRRPMVTPIPTVQPATVPFPNPQPQPERKVAPPSPAPQPQPSPQRLPDQNPLISPVTPQPATTPTTTPAPFIPVVVPQVTPNRTTQTNADGSRKTAFLPGVITTPAGNEKIGPVTITTNAPQATLAGIAGEVGRIEQKLAKIINNTGDDWMDTAFGIMQKVLNALLDAFLTGQPAGEYILSSPCEKDEQGDRIEYQVPILSTQNKFAAIYARLDALADLIQTHKDLKQPICRGTQPTGQPVTVNFSQIE